MQSELLVSYLQRAVDHLLEQGGFDGGQPLRDTQWQCLEAYKAFLADPNLTLEERLKGFFEIPTGIGKTAVFVGIISAAYAMAEAEGQSLRSIVVVPTTQLLNQTKEDFLKFAPQTAGKVGLFGDGHKSLKLPITIATYNAWYDLSQKGIIGPHNVDILLSDEAHRGTSERRIENISGIFNAQTAQIAFTATAHFDEEKSVQASHEREIFYKGIRDAVLGDELASYIQSQRAVIRVAPTPYMHTEEYKKHSSEQKAAYRRKIRQKAWNEFAVKGFKEGVDERTGEPLTDNQAGFFVEGIAQANHLEKLLNQDEELQRRAKEKGCIGVALAIHSHLSATEQRERFEAYKAGKYLAVIGDEKFKEGFDHPPMKTIFDSAHSSLVDKAQILGRGARKWWNELKGRFEGLTLIDTISYVGSEDKDEDARYREAALRKAVSARDILEESYIIGPSAPKVVPASKMAYGSSRLLDFDEGLEVEYYGSIEDVYHLDNEVARLLREHMVPITKDMRNALISLFSELNISAGQLVRNCDDLPEGLYEHKINRWMNGYTKEEDPELLKFVIDKLQAIKDGTVVLKISPACAFNRKEKLANPNRIKVTNTLIAELNDLIELTGMSGTEILKYVDDDKPADLNRSLLAKWAAGKVKTIDKAIVEYVLDLYRRVLQQFQDKGLDPRRVEITEETKNTMATFNQVVGMGVVAKELDAPEGLKKSVIYCWLTGQATSARKYQLDFVMSRWKELVDRKSVPAP